MRKKKKQEVWMETLVSELNEQAQKSFQVGLFEQITNPALEDEEPGVIKALNNALNCANLLLNHARENMVMLNRINHSGMWSMYFDDNQQVSRVVYSDEFRQITGYSDRKELEDTLESWNSKIHDHDREQVMQKFQETVEDTTGTKEFDVE